MKRFAPLLLACAAAPPIAMPEGPPLEVPDPASATALYDSARREGRLHERLRPARGDLVFFHNTSDANGNGRDDDWLSLVGVVEASAPGGAVRFLWRDVDHDERGVLSLLHPDERRGPDGQVLNSYLRVRRKTDSRFAQYLAGELFAGFACVRDCQPFK